MEKILLQVEGMGCQHCVGVVEDVFKKIEGVTSVKVNLSQKEVEVLSKEELDIDSLQRELEELGYNLVF